MLGFLLFVVFQKQDAGGGGGPNFIHRLTQLN